MIGRLVQTADFKRLLGVPPRWRSAHFSVHHLQQAPTMRVHRTTGMDAPEKELSTGHEPFRPQPVDDGRSTVLATPDRWLGCVVPKRQARRAVTRNLIKRQIRSAAQRMESGLPSGLWLVRLRQGFPVAEFPSADSSRLRHVLRDELDRLFGLVMKARP